MNEIGVIRRLGILLAVTLVALTLLPAPAHAQDASDLERLLASVNEARGDVLLSPLYLSPQLTSAAQLHSADMASSDVLTHTGSDGSTFVQRIEATGYWLANGAQSILYQMDADPGQAFSRLWSSPEHQVNLISSQYREIGIGFAESTSGKVYYTILLASPAALPPPLPLPPGSVAPLASTDPIPLSHDGDGRLNPGLTPIVVYCAPGGGVAVWRVNMATSQGQQVIFASLADIGTGLAQVASSGANTLIASAGDVSLWALAHNELQAQTTDGYRFAFKADRCGTPAVAVGPASSPETTQETIPPPAVFEGTHVVQRGETLFRIALRYGTTVQALALANGISNPRLIYAGQVLVIPDSAVFG